MLASRLFNPSTILRAARSPFHPPNLHPKGLSNAARLRCKSQSRPFSSTRSQQRQNPFGETRYQRFDNRSGARTPPIITLLQRWSARQTFKYEVSGLAGGVGGVYLYNLETVPVSGRRRFNVVSEENERSMGQELYKQVMSEFGDKILPDNDPRSRLVQKVLTRLIPSSGLDSAEWEVHVIDSAETNAFVIPGGKVFVFTGILPICAGEAGVAAVLGHEIAHNLAHHSAEKMSKGYILALAFMLLQYVVELPDFASQMLLTLGFERPGSRAQESEADYIGMLMMAQSCYDPEAAVDLWGRMQEAEKEHDVPPQMLSTHPSSANRQAKLREWLPKALERYDQSECGAVKGYIQDFHARVKEDLL